MQKTPSTLIEVKNLSKRYGDTPVLRGVSFEIIEGEFLCFLGPSGCGKTTLLFCLAGLEQATSGDILKNGTSLLNKPTSQRDVGIVFQSYALFPNLTVTENIRFGLENLKKTQHETKKIVNELITLLSLTGHENKYPSQLSGGQQQRVALARAIAVSPSLLLLDEPLSALDAQVRTRLRGELRDLQLRLGITTIMVTHDQEEAQSLADRIVLMDHGVIEQIGSPWEIYNEPRTPFVADFIGVSNLFEAEVVNQQLIKISHFMLKCNHLEQTQKSKVTALIRPECVSVFATAQDDCFASGILEKIEFLGPIVRLHVTIAAELKIISDVTQKLLDRDLVRVGTRLWLRVQPCDIKLLSSREVLVQ